jgi:hypothetical protein
MGLTADEECITGEDRAILAVFEQIADAILSVTRSMVGCDFDVVAYFECVAMARHLIYLRTVLATDDSKLVGLVGVQLERDQYRERQC